jgi:hypothetical protein
MTYVSNIDTDAQSLNVVFERIMLTNFGMTDLNYSDFKAKSNNLTEHSSAEIYGYSMQSVIKTSMNQFVSVMFS